MGYPYSRRIAASSLSPSAPLRCDLFPPFARLASPACELLTFCGVAYHPPSFNVSCGFLTALIAYFKEPHRPNLAGEKMANVIVAVTIFCSKVLVDQRRIVKRRNILATVPFVLRTKIWHNSANPYDLVCLNRQVWSAGMFFVLLEVVPKDA